MSRPTRRTRRDVIGGATKMGLACALGGLAGVLTGCDATLPLPGTQSRRTVALTAALPTGGANGVTNELVQAGVRAGLEQANSLGAGRFSITLHAVSQAAGNAAQAAQASTLAQYKAAGAALDLLVLTDFPVAGTAPQQLVSAHEQGLLGPLDEYLKTDRSLTQQDFHAPALDACRQHGKLTAIPLMAAPTILTYDVNRFQGVGLGPPAGWDWRRLVEAAGRLTRDTDRDGAPDEYGLDQGYGTSGLLSFIWQNGGNVISADGKLSMISDQAAYEAIDFVGDFFRDGAISPPVPQSTLRAGTSAGGIRYNDRWWIGMLYGPGSHIAPLTDPALGIAELPRGRERVSPLAVTALLALPRSVKDPGVAAQALAVLAEETSKRMVLSARRQPAAALQALEPRLTPQLAQTLVDSLGQGRALVLPTSSATVRLHEALSQMIALLRSRRPTADVVQTTSQSIQKLLDSL